MTHLNHEQITLIDQSEPLIRGIEGQLPDELRASLTRLQVASAEAYAAGMWNVPGSPPIPGPKSPQQIPTIEETKRVLSAVEGFILDDNAHRPTLHKLIADLKLDEPHRSTAGGVHHL